jgi:hypothetical protein
MSLIRSTILGYWIRRHALADVWMPAFPSRGKQMECFSHRSAMAVILNGTVLVDSWIDGRRL